MSYHLTTQGKPSPQFPIRRREPRRPPVTKRDCQTHALAVSWNAVDIAQPVYYSALASSAAGAASAASALGAAFLPARRVVFLAAGLAADLSMFSL